MECSLAILNDFQYLIFEQELGLRGEFRFFKAMSNGGLEEQGKIHIRCEVLFADVFVISIADPVLIKGPHRPL